MSLEDITKKRTHLASVYEKYLGRKLVYPFVYDGVEMVPARRNLTVYLINLLDEYGIKLEGVPTTSDKPSVRKKATPKYVSPEEVRANPPRQLRTSEAARYVGVSERTLRSLVAERKIPFVRIRRRIVFRLVDLDRWIEDNLQGEKGGDQ